MKRGIILDGGGVGFSVVRSRLEPSAEYEYVFAVLKLTCELTEPDAKRKPAGSLGLDPELELAVTLRLAGDRHLHLDHRFGELVEGRHDPGLEQRHRQRR